jgi:hypothetical protein
LVLASYFRLALLPLLFLFSPSFLPLPPSPHRLHPPSQIIYIGRDEVKLRLAHTPIEAVIKRENLSSRADVERMDLRNVLQRDQVGGVRNWKAG